MRSLCGGILGKPVFRGHFFLIFPLPSFAFNPSKADGTNKLGTLGVEETFPYIKVSLKILTGGGEKPFLKAPYA